MRGWKKIGYCYLKDNGQFWGSYFSTWFIFFMMLRVLGLDLTHEGTTTTSTNHTHKEPVPTFMLVFREKWVKERLAVSTLLLLKAMAKI